MSESCPVLTPEERRQVEILQHAERGMMAAILEAIDDAHGEVARGFASIGLGEGAPPRDYFAAVAQQKLFLLLCGADPDTMEGGNPDIAAGIIDNGRRISEHYWTGKSRS